MVWNKVQTMLFSPKAFQVGTGGKGGVGFSVHAGEVGNNKTVDKAKSG